MTTTSLPSSSLQTKPTTQAIVTHSTGATATAVSLRDVKKSFGPRVILNGATLDIPKGSTQVILGQSGSGKSVLLKCLLGLLPMDSGDILVNGKSVKNITEKERAPMMRKMSMLFQSGALFDSLTVGENVAFVQIFNDGMDAASARKLAIEKLEMVGLRKEVANQSPSELSGGMRKRAALARAIASNPELILYDEPTTGLDPVTSDVISKLIRKLQHELKCTSIVITHDMPCAFNVADNMAFLYQGKFLANGSPDEFRHTDAPILRQFIDGHAEGPMQVLA